MRRIHPALQQFFAPVVAVAGHLDCVNRRNPMDDLQGKLTTLGFKEGEEPAT